MSREDITTLASEIPGLPMRAAEFEQENDLYRAVLSTIDQLGQVILAWDGTPERLQDMAAQFCQELGCRALAFSFFEAEHLRRSIVEPPDTHISLELTKEHIDLAFQERQPVSIDDTCVLYVPLCSPTERLGLVQVLFDHIPTCSDVLIWRALGVQLALTVANRTLRAQAERAQQREKLLHDVIKHTTSDIDLDKMLASVLKLTIPMVGADDGSIILLDDQRRVVRHIFQQGELGPRIDREVVQEAISFGLAGWMIEHQQGTVVQDTISDDRWIKLEAVETVRSAVGVPLVRGDVTRGLLLLVHRSPDHFHQRDLDFLTSVADQATIVVENAYLLALTQQRVRELDLINEISQATSSLHLNDVLRIVTQRVVEALQARRCAVFLLDESRKQVVLCAVHNPDVSNDNMNMVVSLADRPHIAGAIKTHRPIEIKDVFADERLRHFWDKAHELDIKMQIAVPLMTQQQVIGAISIDRGESDPAFSNSDLDLMMTIAHQAANAISNARLYQEAQSRAEQLWLANRVSHDIGTQLDINQLVWEIVRLIRETFDCYYVAVGLIEGEDLVFRSGISYLYQTTPTLSLSLDSDAPSIAGWAARRGRSVLVRDVREDPRYKLRPGLEELRSQLSVPLKVRDRAQPDTEAPDQTIGVLDVGSTQIGAFSEGDQQLLESLGAQISVAIENARLFGRVQEERARLEAILNGTDDAIIITDVSDHVLFLNPAAQLAFGNGDTLFPGCPLSQAVRNQELWAFWQQAVGDEAHAAEITLPDGRTLHANITPVSGVGKVAVMQDITYLKELDEIKSDFVSTVSHDLRSPLQVIQSSAELIPRAGSVNQEQRRQVEHILAIVRRISDLVQNLLDIGRIEAGVGMDIEPCALDEIIARSAGACRSLARDKGLDFSVELPRTLPLVSGNPLRLDQVISNLVTNAIKFTPEGSVTVAARSKGDWVTIEVRDTGIGIPPEAQDKLFEKFYRVQSPDTRGIQGTGLGLAIVKSIVESHGGTIEVESFPNLGSTFIVCLPVCAQPVPR